MHQAVEQHLQHRGDDAAAAGAAGGQPGALVGPEHQRGGHRTEGPAAGGDGVLCPLAQAVGIGGTGLGREVVHLVVEQEARPRHRDAIAIGGVEGGGERHQAAVAVHHREVGGVGALRQGGGFGLQLRRRPVAIGAQPLPLLGGMAIAEQPIQRHRHLGGIPQQAVAVAVGEVHRLHHCVDRGGAVQARGRQIQGLQHLEQLQQGGATAAGGRHGEHAVAAERGLQRRGPGGPVGRQVGGADQAIAAGHQRHQGPGQAAAVEAGRPLGGDAAQAGRQLRLPQGLPRCVGLAAGLEKLLRTGRIRPQQGRRRPQRTAELRPHREAPLRQVDGRGQHRRQRQTAVTGLHLGEPRHAARHRRAQQAAQGPVAVDAAIGVEEQIGPGPAGGRFTEVEGHRLAAAHGDRLRGGNAAGHGGAGANRPRARQPQHQKPTTAEVAGLRQGHRQGKRRGHGRIHGIAAAAQNRRPHRRRPGLLGRHHATAGFQRLRPLGLLLQQVGSGRNRGRRGGWHGTGDQQRQRRQQQGAGHRPPPSPAGP